MNPITLVKTALDGALFKNKYKMYFNVPQGDTTGSIKDSSQKNYNEVLDVLCTNVSFPSRKVSTVTATHRGRKYILRGIEENQDIMTVTIMEDRLCSVRRLFENWLMGIDSQVNKSNWEGYMTTMKIVQLDHDGDPIFGYEFTNCFINEIGSVDFSDSSQNEIVTYSLNFSYSKCYPLSSSDLKSLK